MRVEEYDGKLERRVLTGMVVNGKFLSRISSSWKDGSFSSPWANIIGGWCVSHWKKHSSAPRKGVIAYLERWSQRTRNQATVDLVTSFLQSLSDEYGRENEINPGVLLDSAGELFDRVRITKLREAIDVGLDSGSLDGIKEKVVEVMTFGQEIGAGRTRDYFFDEDFSHLDPNTTKNIITYGGDLDLFFAHILIPNSFVVLLAPIKSKKSYTLMDMGFRSALQRNRTVYFDVGDMTDQDVFLRFDTRIARNPLWSPTGWPLQVRVPVAVHAPHTQKYTGPHDFVPADVDYKTKIIRGPLTREMVMEARRKALSEKMKTSKTSYLKVSCWPTGSITVEGIRTELNRWKAEEGWHADVVIVDYADLLDPLPKASKLDERGQINSSWKALNTMAQEEHLLFVTATQGNKESFNRVLLDRNHFSDDKRKLAHPTAVIGVNITEKDKERGLTRFNVIAARHVDYDPRRHIHVAGNLTVANLAMKSIWPKLER